ncbi:MAG: hypothetical protein EKK63_18370 [Acinetobacter sp.]|uniref:hypothetical protein n=1 Tax=Acinetobacter sp. TaxID=472 RepID=UPI000F932709|nr:hypothetical protein [Acinetobacter sp.]RUP36127.1 MAG: hypothetical protein EKK63_18370 [Acinetobacter sp.]
MSKQIFGWDATKKATALPKKKVGANQITTNIIQQCSLQGCKVFRNNVLGVFDAAVALKKIWSLVQSSKVTTAELKKALQSSYRKSHEELGASDILGCTPKGLFLAIEIKAKGDQLDKDGGYNQENFLKEIGQKGGVCFIVTEEPEKIRLRVMGSEKYITICHPDDFLKLFVERLKQPYA